MLLLLLNSLWESTGSVQLFPWDHKQRASRNNPVYMTVNVFLIIQRKMLWWRSGSFWGLWWTELGSEQLTSLSPQTLVILWQQHQGTDLFFLQRPINGASQSHVSRLKGRFKAILCFALDFSQLSLCNVVFIVLFTPKSTFSLRQIRAHEFVNRMHGLKVPFMLLSGGTSWFRIYVDSQTSKSSPDVHYGDIWLLLSR